MASNRSPLIALVMGIIPFVNLYLIYKWWSELKAAGKSDKDPLLWTLLMIVPLVNFYAIYQLFTAADGAARAAKKESYPLGVLPLMALAIVGSFFMGLGLVVFLYMIYKTQDMLNQCGI